MNTADADRRQVSDKGGTGFHSATMTRHTGILGRHLGQWTTRVQQGLLVMVVASFIVVMAGRRASAGEPPHGVNDVVADLLHQLGPLCRLWLRWARGVS